MKKYLEILQQCALFQQIERDDLLKMLGCLGAKVESFDKKYTVMAEGNPVKYIGIVLSGSVQISQVDYFGNRCVLGNIEASEVFAEAFACAGVSAMSVSVIANEQSRIMLIDCARILHTCSNNCGFHRQLIFNLMKNLAFKNIQFHQRIEVTSKRTTRDKLMTYLLQQAKRANSSSFTIPFDRQALADYLEVDRSGLSMEISKLRKEGIIESNRKYFKIL